MAEGEGDEMDWAMEAISQFMKSPAYTVPVVDFIDENCLAFDNEEESKLELSAIHNKFIETVFGLLETYLQEIGVSQEQFSAACQQQLTVGGRNAFVFQQIMATDDFQAFKKMMVSRHRQLEYENLKLLQRQQLAAGMHEDAALSEGGAPGLPGKGPTPAPASESEGEEEDAELQEAIRLSREQCEIFSAHDDDDAQLEEVLRLSAQESEMAPRRAHSPATPNRLAGLQPAGLTEEELVAAAIQESIKASPDEFSAGESLPVSAPPTAASLPATVESVEDAPLLHDDACKENVNLDANQQPGVSLEALKTAADNLACTPAGRPRKGPMPQPAEEDLLPPDPMELEKVRALPVVTDAELRAAKAAHDHAVMEHALAVHEALARADDAQVGLDADTATPTATSGARSHQGPAPAALGEDDATGAGRSGGSSLASGSSLPPIGGIKSSMSSLDGLPPIGVAPPQRWGAAAGARDLVPGSMAAEDMMKAERQRELRQRRKAERDLLKKKTASHMVTESGLDLSPEDIAERKAHLEKQRAKLLEAKKKDREDSLRSYQAKSQENASVARRVSEKHQQVANEVLAAMSEIDVNRKDSADGLSADDRKKLELRKALAQRLKDDMAV